MSIYNNNKVKLAEQATEWERHLASQLLRLNHTRFYSPSLGVTLIDVTPLGIAERYFSAECQRAFLSEWWYLRPELPSIDSSLKFEDALKAMNLTSICKSMAPVQLMAPLQMSTNHHQRSAPYLPIRWHGLFGDNSDELDDIEHSPDDTQFAGLDYIVWKIRPKN